jgi:hypothetical protein
MIIKGYRVTLTSLLFYISTFIILAQLWVAWKQSSSSYLSYIPSSWRFNPDLHANVHTLSHEQCDISFPKLYHSLHASVKKRKRKISLKDIEIKEGRCMVRVLIHGGEVRIKIPN